MINSKYEIGKLEVDQSNLKSKTEHKILASGIEDKILFYVKPAPTHIRLVKEFKLNPLRILGGGNIYVNSENKLVIDDLSLLYGPIPNKAAASIVKVIQEDIKRRGIETNGTLTDTKDAILSEAWENLGFKEGLVL